MTTATKTFVIKETGMKQTAGGMVLAVTLLTPPTVIGTMTLASADMPVTIEVPTSTETLIADLERYAAGATIVGSFSDPTPPIPAVSPAPAAAPTAAAPAVAASPATSPS